jgi:hypothetical protein
MASMHLRGWSKGSEVLLDNNPIGTIGAGGNFSSIPPGQHEIKVVDKKGESGTMQKSFAPGERADLAKKDFAVPSSLPLKPPPPPPLNTEDHDWQQTADSGSITELEQFRAKYPKSQHLGDLGTKLDDLYWGKATSTGTAAGFNEYLSKVPNGKHQSEAQQEIAWSQAETNNTIQSLQEYEQRYPQEPHFAAARKKIEDLKRAEDQNKDNQRFQEARNSTDEGTLESFLKDYPSGSRHDQIYERLDDVIWAKTRKDDVASLQAYVGKMPSGRYVSRAHDTIERLTSQPPPPPLSLPGDDKRIVKNVLEQYRLAYEHRNIGELKAIWPGMTDSAVSGLRRVFRDADSVRMTCNIVEGPDVDGDRAVIRFTQSLAITGQPQSAQQVVMTLKRVKSNWQIESVR